jgi:hypothetical protein
MNGHDGQKGRPQERPKKLLYFQLHSKSHFTIMHSTYDHGVWRIGLLLDVLSYT